MKYSAIGYNGNSMARALGIGLPISRKQSIEICNFIRNRDLQTAKELLEGVIKKVRAVPFKRFNKDMGHKRKVGPAGYPVKSSEEILKLIESVEANAQFKGLNTSRLYIRHICANQGSKAIHLGRHSRRKMKRTNIEVVVAERETKKNEKK